MGVARPPGAHAPTVTLISWEDQIARLAAQGATNDEIAARLYLSVHNVPDTNALARIRAHAERLGYNPMAGEHADGAWVEVIDPGGISTGSSTARATGAVSPASPSIPARKPRSTRPRA
jgi:hypothetical protein